MMRRFSVLAAFLLLAGCVDYTHSEFVTNQSVDLHLSQDAVVTARVPRGTAVKRLGWVSSECECWLVATPYGAGFVFTRYLDMQLVEGSGE